MNEKGLPNLSQFLGGYFNQDYDLCFSPDLGNVVDIFIGHAKSSELRDTLAELDKLLSMGLSEQELGKACSALGCDITPVADGLTYYQWLGGVRARLAKGLEDKGV
jgi:hypothetical protein